MGGWGGCLTCFCCFFNSRWKKRICTVCKRNKRLFSNDGIDLDWEYPAIQGPPGHPFSLADRSNFTILLKELRKTLGKEMEISFAAGGFTSYLEKSVDWEKSDTTC
jgi:chitinase